MPTNERKFALLGGSLKHTMSPPIHSRLFELKNRKYAYEVCETSEEELKDRAHYLNSLGGYNVTIPYKIGIIDYLDRLDSSAKRYGAVNCVCKKDGQLTGFNTDCDGFLRTVSAMGVKLDGEILLVGCGGVGRMMAIEAALSGASLTVAVLESDLALADKTKSEILTLKADAKAEIVTVEKIDKNKSYDLLINATPVGMYPKVNACPVDDEVINAASAVFDVIYNPTETVLIKKAKSLGKTCAGGMAMLVWQAVSAHEIWDGDSYSESEVAAIISEMENRVNEDFKL